MNAVQILGVCLASAGAAGAFCAGVGYFAGLTDAARCTAGVPPVVNFPRRVRRSPNVTPSA